MKNKIRVNALNIGWMNTPGEDKIQKEYHKAKFTSLLKFLNWDLPNCHQVCSDAVVGHSQNAGVLLLKFSKLGLEPG